MLELFVATFEQSFCCFEILKILQLANHISSFLSFLVTDISCFMFTTFSSQSRPLTANWSFVNLHLIYCFFFYLQYLAAIFHFSIRLHYVMLWLMLKFLNWSGGFFSLFRFFIKGFSTKASGSTIFTDLILPSFLFRHVG